MTLTAETKETVVRRACDAVATHPDKPWSNARLATIAGASPVQLQRAFRSVLGISPRDFITASKRRKFLDALKARPSVTEAIYEAGPVTGPANVRREGAARRHPTTTLACSIPPAELNTTF